MSIVYPMVYIILYTIYSNIYTIIIVYSISPDTVSDQKRK